MYIAIFPAQLRWGHCDLRYCGNGGHEEGSVGNVVGSEGGGEGSFGGMFQGVATTNLDSNGRPCFTVRWI